MVNVTRDTALVKTIDSIEHEVSPKPSIFPTREVTDLTRIAVDSTGGYAKITHQLYRAIHEAITTVSTSLQIHFSNG